MRFQIHSINNDLTFMQGKIPGGHICIDRLNHAVGSSVAGEKSVRSMTRSKKSVMLSKVEKT